MCSSTGACDPCTNQQATTSSNWNIETDSPSLKDLLFEVLNSNESRKLNSTLETNDMVYDRLKMEKQIMSAWNVTQDMTDLCTGVLEHEFTPDKVSNVLIGLSDLYNMRFEQLFFTFELSIKDTARLEARVYDAESDLHEMKDLIQEFFRILKIQEASEEGNLFNLTKITSCRAVDMQQLSAVLTRLNEMSQED